MVFYFEITIILRSFDEILPHKKFAEQVKKLLIVRNKRVQILNMRTRGEYLKFKEELIYVQDRVNPNVFPDWSILSFLIGVDNPVFRKEDSFLACDYLTLTCHLQTINLRRLEIQSQVDYFLKLQLPIFKLIRIPKQVKYKLLLLL